MEILSVELLSDNLDSTEDFYTGVLGLQILDKSDNHLKMKAGSSELLFTRSFNQRPVYHLAFNIPQNTVEEAYFWVHSKCPVLEVEENEPFANFEAWNARSFYFLDNNGNVLEFITRYDLPDQTRQPFTASVITSIGEIAIATENVGKYANELSRLTGVKDYEKQPRHDNFAALGDDRGLFILSQTGRHWFPTEKPSEKFFTRVKIRVGDTVSELSLHEDTLSDI